MHGRLDVPTPAKDVLLPKTPNPFSGLPNGDVILGSAGVAAGQFEFSGMRSGDLAAPPICSVRSESRRPDGDVMGQLLPGASQQTVCRVTRRLCSSRYPSACGRRSKLHRRPRPLGEQLHHGLSCRLFGDLCPGAYFFTRCRFLYAPLVWSVTLTSLSPRLRQNQPCVPSKPAVKTPLSPASPRPFL